MTKATTNQADDRPTKITGFRIPYHLVGWLREATVRESIYAAEAIVDTANAYVKASRRDDLLVAEQEELVRQRHADWVVAVARPRQIKRLASHLGGLHELVGFESGYVPVKCAAELLAVLDWLENDLRAKLELGWDDEPDLIRNHADVLHDVIRLRNEVAAHVPDAPAPVPGNRGGAADEQKTTIHTDTWSTWTAGRRRGAESSGTFEGLDQEARRAAAEAIVSDCQDLIAGLSANAERVVDTGDDEWRARVSDFTSYLRSLAALQPALDALVGHDQGKATGSMPKAQESCTAVPVVRASPVVVGHAGGFGPGEIKVRTSNSGGPARAPGAVTGPRSGGAVLGRSKHAVRAADAEPMIDLRDHDAKDLLPLLYEQALDRVGGAGNSFDHCPYGQVSSDVSQGRVPDEDDLASVRTALAELRKAIADLDVFFGLENLDVDEPFLAIFELPARMVRDLANSAAASEADLMNGTSGDPLEDRLKHAKNASRLLVLAAAAARHLPTDKSADYEVVGVSIGKAQEELEPEEHRSVA